LGIEAVWLMPIMESPSYHKYDVTNYKSVHPDYGTEEEFKNFVSEAHKRGIYVIIDFIINHTSNEHPWFLESRKGINNPYRDYYNWELERDIINEISKREISHDSDNVTQWHKSEGNEALYYGVFYGGMPDLNYDNPKVLDEITEAAKYWLEGMNVDGFRLDAAKHIFREHRIQDNHTFWKKFRSNMVDIKPDVYLVGEVWADAKTSAPYSEGLPVLFNFDLAFSILESVNNGKESTAFISGHGHEITDNQSLIGTLLENKKTFIKTNPNFTDGVFLSNHDQNRVMTVLGNDIEKAKLAAAIYLTLPGQPYIYYGEEIGMKGQKPDELIREPFLWDVEANDIYRTKWVKSKHTSDSTVNPLSQQLVDESSIFNFYKRLIGLRKSTSALSTGDLAITDIDDNEILSYYRLDGNDSILIIHNLSNTEKEIERTKSISEFDQIQFVSSNVSIIEGKIIIPAKSSIILSQE
jgi:glycosidase